LVADMYNNKNTSFGMMLKLVDEVKFRSLIFANSDHQDQTKWPQLKICYQLANSLGETKGVVANPLLVYPNPVGKNEWVQINTNGTKALSISLLDLTGKLIYNKDVDASAQAKYSLDLSAISNLATGTYFLKVISENQTQIQKLIIQ